MDDRSIEEALFQVQRRRERFSFQWTPVDGNNTGYWDATVLERGSWRRVSGDTFRDVLTKLMRGSS